MTAEKFLESNKMLRIVGGKPIMVVSVKDALIALEITILETKIETMDNYDISTIYEERKLQALKTKHSIS